MRLYDAIYNNAADKGHSGCSEQYWTIDIGMFAHEMACEAMDFQRNGSSGQASRNSYIGYIIGCIYTQ